MDYLIFSKDASIKIATNTFINVPIILQLDDLPLIEVVQTVDASYTVQIPIFHPDGTKLAVAKGTQLYDVTEAGKKSGLTYEHPDKMTVCKLGNQTLFEIRRQAAAALKMQAELFTPNGRFVKCTDSPIAEIFKQAPSGMTMIGNLRMMGCTFSNCRIGIHLKSVG